VSAHFKPGDFVIYRKQKVSVHPGPHAKYVYPAPYGDFYTYEVHKFWTVVAVQNNEIVVCTRRGKHLTLKAEDSSLRRANLLEWFFYRHRFPVLNATDASAAGTEQLQPYVPNDASSPSIVASR
jgi:hypothetical protein